MTTFPYALHLELVKATAPLRQPIRDAIGGWSLARKLLEGSAKLVVDTRNTVWYYKGTSVEIAYSQQTGYVLMDHVRKLRSPGLNNLSDAIDARAKTLKELASADQTAQTEASGVQAVN